MNVAESVVIFNLYKNVDNSKEMMNSIQVEQIYKIYGNKINKI